MDKQEKIAGDTVAWEAICEHCGRCCYEKYEYQGRIFYGDTPCEYLDLETNLCRIYAQRSELNPECARLTPKLVKSGILPPGCPYVTQLKPSDSDR